MITQADGRGRAILAVAVGCPGRPRLPGLAGRLAGSLLCAAGIVLRRTLPLTALRTGAAIVAAFTRCTLLARFAPRFGPRGTWRPALLALRRALAPFDRGLDRDGIAILMLVRTAGQPALRTWAGSRPVRPFAPTPAGVAAFLAAR